MSARDHDPAGWVNYCSGCGRAYWAAWQSSGAHVKRMDWAHRERPHVCAEAGA